jgi:hypothetical protein
MFYSGNYLAFNANRGFGDTLHQGSQVVSLVFSSFFVFGAFVSFVSALALHSVSLHLSAELQDELPPWSVQ